MEGYSDNKEPNAADVRSVRSFPAQFEVLMRQLLVHKVEGSGTGEQAENDNQRGGPGFASNLFAVLEAR